MLCYSANLSYSHSFRFNSWPNETMLGGNEKDKSEPCHCWIENDQTVAINRRKFFQTTTATHPGTTNIWPAQKHCPRLSHPAAFSRYAQKNSFLSFNLFFYSSITDSNCQWNRVGQTIAYSFLNGLANYMVRKDQTTLSSLFNDVKGGKKSLIASS